jgi:uncharacterized protein (TIGR02646 family)
MIRIIKDDAPEFWTKFFKHNRKIRHYDDLIKSDEGNELRYKIRSHMLSQQKYICCYCCGETDENYSHNEHIKPRDKKPELSLDYGNMIVSCNSPDQCGKAKDKYYSEKDFISPLDEDVEEQFEYNTNGEIIGVSEKAKKTIEILRLNSFKMTEARKALYNNCVDMVKYCGLDYLVEEYINEKNGKLPRYVGMVKYFYDNHYFDNDVIL